MSDFSEAVENAKRGHSSKIICPAHDDQQPSLHVSPGDDGSVLLCCHAGCANEEILDAEGATWDALFQPREEPVSIAPITYSYTDENGQELFQAIRFNKPGGRKEFRQRHKDDKGQWVWNLNGVRRVLYRLPDVTQAVSGGEVTWLAEGEKDVESLVAQGLHATCNPMGAGKWLPEYTETLAGSRVHIIADADRPGRQHARAVAELLREADCDVRTFETDLPGCKDVTDHLNAGGTVESLIETTVVDSGAAGAAYGVDILDFMNMTFSEERFIIPGTLAREERLLLTGLEGRGKSTWLRQVAAQCSAGIHPFTGADIQPVKVMMLDAENSPRQSFGSWQRLVSLCAHHGHPIDRGMLQLLNEYMRQPDLTSIEGRDWFFERVTAYKPDLILIGPIQNVTSRDVKDDEVVRKLKRTIDEAREISAAAVIMEHHAPHRQQGDKRRSIRPYGSSLFLKWPDYGFGLNPTETEGVYDWERTRWPRERSRMWPERMRQGKPNTAEFPWMEDIPTDGGTVHDFGGNR